MISKKILLEYIDDLEKAFFTLEEKMDRLSCRVNLLETKKTIACNKKPSTSVKRGPGRPKGSKTKKNK